MLSVQRKGKRHFKKFTNIYNIQRSILRQPGQITANNTDIFCVQRDAVDGHFSSKIRNESSQKIQKCRFTFSGFTGKSNFIAFSYAQIKIPVNLFVFEINI